VSGDTARPRTGKRVTSAAVLARGPGRRAQAQPRALGAHAARAALPADEIVELADLMVGFPDPVSATLWPRFGELRRRVGGPARWRRLRPAVALWPMDGEFAAIWLFDEERIMHVGGAVVCEDALHLLDVVPGDAPDWAVPLEALDGVSVANADRDLGRVNTVVLDLSGGGRVRVLALGAGATSELRALLARGVQPPD
jgi:hypothetical protein